MTETSSKPLIEKFRENVNAYNNLQESDTNTRTNRAFYAIMDLMDSYSKRGKREVKVSLASLGILPGDKEYIGKRVLAEGLTWAEYRAHSFQCDCDQAEGCTTFIKIGFPM